MFTGSEVLVFGSGVARYVDVDRSTPSRLVERELVLRVDLEPRVVSLEAAPGEAVEIPVRLRNRSSVPLGWSDSPFGLSYHLPDRYENARQWFIPTLTAGEERVMTLVVEAPERRGPHAVEIDVVWEGICWLRDRGNPPARVALHVR